MSRLNIVKMSVEDYDNLPSIDDHAIYFLDDGSIFTNGQRYGISVKYYNSIYEFPVIGREDFIYVSKSDNRSYRWSEGQNYYCIGSDWNEIELIDAGFN